MPAHTSYSAINVLRIVFFHLSVLTVFLVPITLISVGIFAALYYLKAFAVSAGYHRYFSHQAFQTNRICQFLIACLCCTTGQRGPLSWATSHRKHHSHSDCDGDPHSPSDGLFHAHIGWLLQKNALSTDGEIKERFKDFPEILWLNKYHSLVFLGHLALTYLLGEFISQSELGMQTNGWQFVVWGGLLSTFMNLHVTCMINSLGHRRNSKGSDQSRNLYLLLPFALGDNWHRNHHKRPQDAYMGNGHWQIDPIYNLLKCLEKIGIIYNLKTQKDTRS